MVSPAALVEAIIEAAKDGAFLGMMSLSGQELVQVKTSTGSWPLPAADYLVIMLGTRVEGEPRVAWLRAEPAVPEKPAEPVSA